MVIFFFFKANFQRTSNRLYRFTLTLFPTIGHRDEIEIDLYDGTGQYPELHEDTPASEHRPDSSLNGGDKLCELFDPSIPLNEAEYNVEYLDIPEQSDIIYTPDELSPWDLLSEPSDPYAPIILSRGSIQSSPVPDSPGLDLKALVSKPDATGVERVLAVGSPPSLPGNLCNGKCKGDLLYVVFPMNSLVEY